MNKCKQHPNYAAINPPRRSKKNPDGCPVCWENYRIVTEAALQELAPKKKKKVTTRSLEATVRNVVVSGQKLRVEQDELTGEYELFVGTHCLFVASSEEDVQTFTAGFREGARYVSERWV